MTAVRQASGMILVDAGMSFPDEEMPGIDLVLPDFTYVREHAGELKGIVLTHGHEDHVGALPYLLREFNVPVYATRLTLGLVRSKLQEFGIKRGDLREIGAGDRQNLGGFGLEFIEVNHSIPGAVAIAIRTNAGVILFSGDYKIDLTPIEGSPMDLGRLAELGKEGLLAYFGDSTNSERAGFVPSERIVGDTLNEVFERSEGRIIVASFASHIHRVSQVVEAAKQHDRLVGVTGRSMIRNVQNARELGYLELPQEMMVDQRDVNKIPDSDIVVLTTGSQGEPLAALSRIANGTHRTIEVGPEDTVVIMEKGDCVEFDDGGGRLTENVAAGMFLVDAGAIAESSSGVMRERQRLSEDGMFIVVARINAQNGQLLGPPDVISRGFVSPQSANGLVDQSIEVVSQTLEQTASQRVTDWGELKNAIRKDLSGFLSERTGKRPIILPLIVEV